MGFPGSLVSRNITPSALASWSDGEIVRAFTEGVSRDGTPLFPLMPYSMYGRHMAQEDAQAVVAYLRTIPPRTQQIAERHLQFPLPLVVRTMPAKATAPATHPDPSDRIAYGGYLVEIAACAECHTPIDSDHAPIPGMRLAGGAGVPDAQRPDRAIGEPDTRRDRHRRLDRGAVRREVQGVRRRHAPCAGEADRLQHADAVAVLLQA